MHLTSYVIVVQGGLNGGLKRMAYNVQIMQYYSVYSCSASQKDFCIPGPQRNFFSCHASGNEKAFLHTNFLPPPLFPFSFLPSPDPFPSLSSLIFSISFYHFHSFLFYGLFLLLSSLFRASPYLISIPFPLLSLFPHPSSHL